jgi:hypothetical protein
MILAPRSSVLLAALVAIPLLGAAPAGAQDAYNLFFRPTEASALAGGTVTLSLRLENRPDALAGVSFGVRHTPEVLSFRALEMGSALEAALGAGGADERFFALDSSHAGGITVAILLLVESPGTSIPPGDDQDLFSIAYDVIASGEAAGEVRIAEDLGSPPVQVVFDVGGGGVARRPTAPGRDTSVAVSVRTSATAPYIRGDVDGNGRLQVTDGIVILRAFFGQEDFSGVPTFRDCLVAYNTDGSTRLESPAAEDMADVGVTDAIYLLNALFQNGPPPPAPFPGCGVTAVPASERMACIAHPACP